MSDTTTTPSSIATAPSAAKEPTATAGSTAAPEIAAAACCDGAAPARAALPPEPRLDLPAPNVGDAVASAALLGDRNRAAIMRMLADGPMCVCEMAASLGERQNNVSMHLARLRDAGLVRAVRHSGDARWMFYERDEERCAAAMAAIAELLR